MTQPRYANHQWREHTGEVELELEASTAEAVFAEAAVALGELIGDGEARRAPATHRQVEVTAADPAALLAEWIGELAFLAEVEGLVPRSAKQVELTDRTLSANVEFGAGSPPHLVKAATYHRLSFERSATGWHAAVVLDV